LLQEAGLRDEEKTEGRIDAPLDEARNAIEAVNAKKRPEWQEGVTPRIPVALAEAEEAVAFCPELVAGIEARRIHGPARLGDGKIQVALLDLRTEPVEKCAEALVGAVPPEDEVHVVVAIPHPVGVGVATEPLLLLEEAALHTALPQVQGGADAGDRSADDSDSHIVRDLRVSMRPGSADGRAR
jgi:hypothetical protein